MGITREGTDRPRYYEGRLLIRIRADIADRSGCRYSSGRTGITLNWIHDSAPGRDLIFRESCIGWTGKVIASAAQWSCAFARKISRPESASCRKTNLTFRGHHDLPALPHTGHDKREENQEGEEPQTAPARFHIRPP